MKNLSTLMGNGVEKTKDRVLDFLIITLNTLYPCRGESSNLIIMNYQAVRWAAAFWWSWENL